MDANCAFCRDDQRHYYYYYYSVIYRLVKHLTYIVHLSVPNSECLLKFNYSKLLSINATQLALQE
jgi:hypothetical protein